MPIKGLSDRDEAFPEIAKIHKGAKKRTNAKGQQIFGEELTYFRVEWGEGEADARAIFESVYGDKPNSIRVIFPFNEIDRFWDPWKTAFTAGSYLGRSDGEFIDFLKTVDGETIVRDGLDREGKKVPHPADDIAGYDFDNKPVYFKDSGILKALIFELPRAAYVSFLTTSKNDIINLSSQLIGYKSFVGGNLAGIPFVVRRIPRLVSTPNGKGKPRVRRKKYLISIELDPEYVARKYGQLRALAMPVVVGEEIAGELPASMETDYDEGELEEPTGAELETEDAPEQAEEAEERIEVLGQWAVEYAAKKWNMETSLTAIELGKKNLGKFVSKKYFVKMVEG